MDFVMSSFAANGAVMRLQFLFRESRNSRRSSFDGMVWVVTEVKDSFSFWVEYSGRHTFYSDSGLYDGVGGLFIGENLADGVLEKVGFHFHWVCFGQGALGKRMW